jgi:hypothetical protein
MNEIQQLNEGFAISINGKSYLIQCRIIQFVFDTKEHQLNVQCINAQAKKYTKHLDGVKDHFYGFDSKYVSFEKHINFDPAHAITNCFNY